MCLIEVPTSAVPRCTWAIAVDVYVCAGRVDIQLLVASFIVLLILIVHILIFDVLLFSVVVYSTR